MIATLTGVDIPDGSELQRLLYDGRGVVSWLALQRVGFTRTDLRRALAAGELLWIRRGWYALPAADPTVRAAVSAGGVCSCVSALDVHGVWVPPTDRSPHVRGRRHAQPAPGRKFCRRHRGPLPERCALDDVATALAHAVCCLDAESIVVVLDSVRHLGLLSVDEIESALRSAPARIRRLLDLCDTAESGTETYVRLRLRSLHLPVRTQVEIPGVGQVDLVVGRRLIIEVDSEEFHGTAADRAKDYERDLQARRLGYLPIRLTYRQVMFGWAAALESILAITDRGEHLKEPIARG